MSLNSFHNKTFTCKTYNKLNGTAVFGIERTGKLMKVLATQGYRACFLEANRRAPVTTVIIGARRALFTGLGVFHHIVKLFPSRFEPCIKRMCLKARQQRAAEHPSVMRNYKIRSARPAVNCLFASLFLINVFFIKTFFFRLLGGLGSLFAS